MKLKILFLNWQDIKHPLGGGAEVYHHEIFKRLAADGHFITWFSSMYRGMKNMEYVDDIQVVRYGGRNTFNYTAPLFVKRLLKRMRYDIVIDSINKIPLMSPKYVKDIPVIAVVHHLFKKTIFQETAYPLAMYVYLNEKRIRRVYRKTPVCAVSESTKRELIDYGLDADRISIIENCVDHKLYVPGPGKQPETPLVGYLGRIKKYKSVEHLIEAFAVVKETVPDAKLVIVGDGDNLPGLKKLARERGIGNDTTFTGYLAEQEKVNTLQQCRVVVNPSVKEGWGLTVIEANACGVPVVAADVPGLRDSVVDGETGLLYPYGDVERCAAHVVSLLKNPAMREKLADNALGWAAKFNWDTAAEKTLALIRQTMKDFHKV